MAERKVHVGIVGAGLGGLAAAIGIARAGHRVTILEQAAVLGEVSPKLVAENKPAKFSMKDWRWHPNTSKLLLRPQTIWIARKNRICLSPT